MQPLGVGLDAQLGGDRAHPTAFSSRLLWEGSPAGTTTSTRAGCRELDTGVTRSELLGRLSPTLTRSG